MFKAPKSFNKEREERKRKHEFTEGDGKQSTTLPRKKTKQHPSSQETANEPSASQDGERGREKSKKPHKHRNETSEERRARREEKKRRKAAKSTAAEA